MGSLLFLLSETLTRRLHSPGVIPLHAFSPRVLYHPSTRGCRGFCPFSIASVILAWPQAVQRSGGIDFYSRLASSRSKPPSVVNHSSNELFTSNPLADGYVACTLHTQPSRKVCSANFETSSDSQGALIRHLEY
jgi:hypothetical protein